MDMTNWNGGEGLTPADAAAEHGAASNAGYGPRPISEALDEFRADLALRIRSPLVTKDASTTPERLDVTLYDRQIPGFTYEFSITSAVDALRWIGHVAPKQWVTTDHLELLASIARGHFSGGKGGA